MTEEAYNKKLADLQQYIPFMENMIGQLKDPKWKPREAQLNKMESLYNMITDKNKKWKYETLLKCEEVILKLQTKVKASKSLTNQIDQHSKMSSRKENAVTTTVTEIMNVLKFNTARAKLHKMQESNETPKSPSPTPDSGVPFEPKIIPVEPTAPVEPPKKFLNIVDPNELTTIWGASLERYTKEKPDIYSSAAQSLVQKKTVFDRLGPVIADPLKPLLTDDDLAQLGSGAEDVYVQNAAADRDAKDDMKIELNLKITPRIVPVPCSKPKCPKVDEKIEKKEKREKEVKVKTVKVDGNASADIFGSLLSSIDTKIIEETKKKDHKKEHHSGGKHKEEKDKSRSKEHQKHHERKKHDKSHKAEKSDKPESGEKEKSDGVDKKEEKTQEDYVSSTVDIPMEKPKRLADKYHPKPRLKQPVEEVGSTSRIEEKEEVVRQNRDPRRRSPPLSMGFFSQNAPSEERQQRMTHPMEGGFEHRPRPMEPAPNYDGRVDTGWPKFPPQQPPEVMPSNSFGSFGRTTEHRFPSFNANNTGFPQDQLPNPMNPLRYEPPVAKFEPPQNPMVSPRARFEPPSSRFEMPRYDNQPPQPQQQQQPHYDHQRHFDHPPKRFEPPRIEPPIPYNRYEPPPVQQGYMGPLLPTPMLPPPIMSVPPPSHQPQFPRKSFNPFEPLNADKEDEPELPGGNFNKREFGYGRYGFGSNARPKFDRPRFDRARVNERFDRRDRFNSTKPFGNRRSLDDDDHKPVAKTDKAESSPNETFSSPLESLYSSPKPVLSASQAKAALDKFKIPKKKQEEKKEEVPVPAVEHHDVDTDSDEDTPLSRKIKRRLFMKIEDSDESESEKKADAKNETSKRAEPEISQPSPPPEKPKPRKSRSKKAAPKPKANKTEKPPEEVETPKREEIEEEKEEPEIESPTRRLRTRPQRTIKPVIVQEERKTPPRRATRSRRVTRSLKAASQELKPTTESTSGSDQETEEKEKVEKTNDEEVSIEEKPVEIPPEKEVKNDEHETNEDVPEKEKVKNELLADIKKTNLKMEETDVLQFILQNYKKIKKIFKSDSSSEEEDETKKKKKSEKLDVPPGIKVADSPSPETKLTADVEPNEVPSETVKDTIILKAEEIKQAISTTREQFTSPERGEKPEEDANVATTSLPEIKPEEEKDEEAKETEVQHKEVKEIEETTESSEDKKIKEDLDETKDVPVGSDTKDVKEDVIKNDSEEIDETMGAADEEETESSLTVDKNETKPVVAKKGNKKKKKSQQSKVNAQQTVRIKTKKKIKKVIAKKRVGRNTRLAAKSKKTRRSELDKLHDDIKEMLMGNEIMTTSGKRSCTMVQKEEKVEVEEYDEDTPKHDAPKTNLLKVMVEKSDFGKILVKDEGGGDEDLPPPVLEKMVLTPPPIDECRKKVIKRKNKWASGIIRKKARKRLYSNKPGEIEKDGEEEEDDEDEFEISDVVEHDKRYFFVHSAKIGCKLCGFKGKLIVQHYRMSHPESEVLISRIEQGIAELFIDDSIKNREKYDAVYPAGKKTKCNFKCPFCLMIIKDTPNAYYNHLCSHTGEYRYGCYHCPYRTFNASNVRTHICQAHSKLHKSEFKPIYPDPQVTRYVFGHLCSECNFVQLIRATVEEHSMVYHPGTPEIYKVNMAALLEEEIAVEEVPSTNLDDCINAVACGAGEIHGRPPSIPAEVKELSVSELLSQIEDSPVEDLPVEDLPVEDVPVEDLPVEDVPVVDIPVVDVPVEDAPIEDDPPVRVKIEPREIEDDPRPIELAAFMCDADLDIEGGVDADGREKMSQWINENTRKARTSIADRLQIKLVNDDGNKASMENKEKVGEEVTTKEKEAVTNDTEKLITMPEAEKETDPLDYSKEEEQPDKPVEQSEKTDVPPAEPDREKELPALLEKTKKQLEVNAPSLFQRMDVMPQKKDNVSVSKIINRLQEKLTAPPPVKPVTQETRAPSQKVFTNMLDMGPIRAIKSYDTLTFSCKVPNCGFIVDDEKSFGEHCRSAHKDFVYVFNTGKCNVCSIKFEYEGKFVTVYDVHLHMMSAHKEFFKQEPVFKLPHDVPNVLSQGSDAAGPKFPFVITNVTSLAPKDSTKTPNLPPPPLVPLPTKDKTQDVDDEGTPASSEIKLPIIASVQSLAVPKSPQQKHLVLTSGAHSKRTLVLRDIPVTEQEKHNKKCPTAVSAMMLPASLNALYKCPKYDCSYSTVHSVSFQRHLARHPTIMNTLVPCLYCDYKVLCNFYAIHLEIRHGHCKFGCGYCFYRATNAYFVQIHRQVVHPSKEPKIIQLRVLAFNNKASSDLASPLIHDLIGTYNCHGDGIPSCPFRTLYFDEYIKHSEVIHHVTRVGYEKSTLERWLERGVGPFQCRYCKKAASNYNVMGRHQALFHFQKPCSFYYRKFVANDTVLIPEQVDLDSPSFTDHLVVLTDQVGLLDCAGSEVVVPAPNPTEPADPPPATTEPAATDQPAPPGDPPEPAEPDRPPKDGSLLDEPEILAADDDVGLLDESDPLCLDDEATPDEPPADDKMPAAELTGPALYKCNCGRAFDTLTLLKSHVLGCVKKPYECVHCGKERKSVLGLLTHYREHGRKRFKCSLCTFRHWQQEAVRGHMRTVHNVSCAIALPALVYTGRKADPESDDYILRPRQTAKSINDINLKVTTVTMEQQSTGVANLIASKLTFGPDDISKLPRQPIYTQPVKCAMCGYETKVKTNMERHLQMHATQNTVPESAPVNPVPCLDKNEKMFDKMVNLASSSHAGGRMGGAAAAKAERAEESVPSFVPSNSRFVCGAENCKYQCLEEAMLRRHILAFHSAETTYRCIHCNTKLMEDKTINVDLVLKHLKLHDAHLYRCSVCSFAHNLKHKVERHLADKHPDKPQNLIVIREHKDSTSEDPVSEKERPWRCGICKFRCGDLSGIKNHVETKHNIDAKYKCALCPVGSDTVEDFTSHFNVNHEGQAVDFIVSYYKEGEARSTKVDNTRVFNTTPLWQRKKSVKHIRGILVDESSSKVSPKKKIAKQRRLDNDEELRLVIEDEGVADKVMITPEVKVGRKRRVKQVNTEDVDGVITIEDDDQEGKKIKLDDNFKGKKKLIVVDLSKLTSEPIEESPKINATNIGVEVDDTLIIEKDSLENTIELGVEHTESILADLEKSIRLDEVEPVTPANSDKNRTSDVEIILPDGKVGEEGGEKRTRTQRSAKIRAFHNIITTTLDDDASPTVTVSEPSKRPPSRQRIKKFKPNEEVIEITNERTDLTVQDVERMTRDELLEGNLVGTYGPYGTPWEGKMKCPLCEKFVASAENEFRYHLYEELQCAPFKCNICNLSSASLQLIELHAATEHDDDGFTVQAFDDQIEQWIKMTIAVQSRIIKLEDKTQTSQVSLGNYFCLFCNYRSEKFDLRQKHLARHFVQKPFICNHCGCGALSLGSMRRHTRSASHCAPLGESITVVDPTDGFLVNPYLKNCRKSAELHELFDEDRAAESENIVKCNYCEFTGPVGRQAEHCQAEHPTETSVAYRYACNVCSEGFVTLVTVNHHFFIEHPGVDVSFSLNDDQQTRDKFVCEECRAAFDDEAELKSHMAAHSSTFRCVYCPQEFSTWRKIVMHVELKHVGKEVVFRFMGGHALESGELTARSVKGGGPRKKNQRPRPDNGSAPSGLSSPVVTIDIQTTPPRLSNSTSSCSVLYIEDSP